MEGSSTLGRRAGAPTSTLPILGSQPSTTQHEALKNFFKRLLSPKDRAASPGAIPGAGTMAAASASPDRSANTAPRTPSWGSAGDRASGSGGSQTYPDAGSGTEDGKAKAFASRVS